MRTIVIPSRSTPGPYSFRIQLWRRAFTPPKAGPIALSIDQLGFSRQG